MQCTFNLCMIIYWICAHSFLVVYQSVFSNPLCFLFLKENGHLNCSRGLKSSALPPPSLSGLSLGDLFPIRPWQENAMVSSQSVVSECIVLSQACKGQVEAYCRLSLHNIWNIPPSERYWVSPLDLLEMIFILNFGWKALLSLADHDAETEYSQEGKLLVFFPYLWIPFFNCVHHTAMW